MLQTVLLTTKDYSTLAPDEEEDAESDLGLCGMQDQGDDAGAGQLEHEDLRLMGVHWLCIAHWQQRAATCYELWRQNDLGAIRLYRDKS